MNRQLAKQYFERSETLQEAGKPEEALALLNQLDEAFPKTKNIGVARARAYASMGRVPEAVRLCEELITLHDSQRARELKDRLVLGLLEPETAKPAAAPEADRKWPRTALKWVAVVVVVISIAWSANRVFSDSDAVPVPQLRERTSNSTSSGDQLSTLVPGRPQNRGSNGQTRRGLNARIPRNAQPKPGLVHPPRTWDLDASGIPVWKSGVFLGVPCINEPARKIDVYIPLAYDEQPETLFPGVVIQMSNGGKLGFIGLEDWAERSEVILIQITSSRNKNFATNHIAQDRALETISTGLRVDQQMGFAIGMSGGGRASWQIACRYPDNFRGIVMMGISGDENVFMPPLHVRLGYIHGEADFNNASIAGAIRMLKGRGYQVREAVVPGGHVVGPLDVRVDMLNWMVSASRRELGIPQPPR
jgi:predicted esterase